MNLHIEYNQPQPILKGQPVIQVEDVAVRYRVAKERIPSIKEFTIRWIKGEISYNEFWALQNINLEIERGEVFGIIGPNGAGKSTLLKVVARVLRPTNGRVRVHGRIAPLLELGAGFDHELTGRENIYLNGAILGYSRKNIEARFHRIVEFAGLAEFIDAPLRTYSTGMIARLGFAVATDVRPEILIVDEILGVGDAEFQTKSFERIQNFQGSGTTILLVTHDLSRVQEMCARAVWLDHGKVVAMGTASAVATQYLGHTTAVEGERLAEESTIHEIKRIGTRKVEIIQVRVIDADGQEQTIFKTGRYLAIQMDYLAHEPVPSPIFGIALHRQDGFHISGPNTAQAGLTLPTINGEGTVTYIVPYLPLLEGLYQLTVAVVNHDDTEIFDYHDQAYPFRVVNDETIGERYGLMTLRGEWDLGKIHG
jgi:lipopolysaccharide transport system ATP-binding protein